MSIKKLSELAPAGTELGKAQLKLVCKYYHIPILLFYIPVCKDLFVTQIAQVC